MKTSTRVKSDVAARLSRRKRRTARCSPFFVRTVFTVFNCNSGGANSIDCRRHWKREFLRWWSISIEEIVDVWVDLDERRSGIVNNDDEVADGGRRTYRTRRLLLIVDLFDRSGIFFNGDKWVSSVSTIVAFSLASSIDGRIVNA